MRVKCATLSWHALKAALRGTTLPKEVEHYLAAELTEDVRQLESGLIGVIAQRLVRTLCSDCRTPFDPDEKIIEYRLDRAGREKLLVSRTVNAFTDELSTDSPAPGGGSVAALCGALAAALASMVANLTVGRRGQEDVWDEMIATAVAHDEGPIAFRYPRGEGEGVEEALEVGSGAAGLVLGGGADQLVDRSLPAGQVEGVVGDLPQVSAVERALDELLQGAGGA